MLTSILGKATQNQLLELSNNNTPIPLPTINSKQPLQTIITSHGKTQILMMPKATLPLNCIYQHSIYRHHKVKSFVPRFQSFYLREFIIEVCTSSICKFTLLRGSSQVVVVQGTQPTIGTSETNCLYHSFTKHNTRRSFLYQLSH